MPKLSKPLVKAGRVRKIDALAPDVKAELQRQLVRYGTQKKLGDAFEVSVAVVSQLLNDKYPGSIDQMQERIRGKWMGKTVQCPVLRTISTLHCLSNQALPFATTNPVRSALGNNCPKCPHRKELCK